MVIEGKIMAMEENDETETHTSGFSRITKNRQESPPKVELSSLKPPPYLKMKSTADLERSWTDLSPEALRLINTKLHHKILRSVCKNWGSSVPPPYKQIHNLLPLTLLVHERGSFKNLTTPAIRLIPTAVFLLRCPGQSASPWWLVAVEQPGGPDCPLRLFHPLTKTRIPTENLSGFHPNLDSVKLSEGCVLRRSNDCASLFPEVPEHFFVSKVLLWRDPSGLHNYSIVKLHNRGKVLECFRLPYWAHQGVFNFKNCTKISLDYDFKEAEPSFRSDAIDDIEIWNGILYAVNCQGELLGIGYQELKVIEVAGGGLSAMDGVGAKRLVASDYGLSLVVCNNKTCNLGEFTVYHLDEETLCWEIATTLGEKNILFVSYDRCFWGNRDELKWFPGNCIVYPKNLYPCFSGKNRYRYHTSVFMDEYLDLRLHRYGQGPNSIHLSQVHCLATVFWPPPRTLYTNHPPLQNLQSSYAVTLEKARSSTNSENTTGGTSYVLKL